MSNDTTYPAFGTVSRATMREDDLCEAFGPMLAELDTAGMHAELVASAAHWAAHEPETDAEREDCTETVAALFDALEGFAPPFAYFGAHPGDGSDYGYWPSLDAVEEACSFGEALKVADLSEVPDGYTGDVFHVNDHGNVTYYTVTDGEPSEVWACV